MSNLIGAQTQWDSTEMLRYLEIVGPKFCMGINVFKREYLLEIRSRGAKYVYRHHPNFDEVPNLARWMDDPEQAAEDATDFLAAHLAGVLDLVDYVVEGNEYILGPDHETSERIVLADRFMAAFIPLARAKLGVGSIVGNFNTGHWRKAGELVEYFPLMLQALQEDCEANPEGGSRIGWHEYNWKWLRDDSYWRTATFLRAMPAIIEQYPLARCLITELGVDRAADEWQAPHEGFRKADPDINVAIDMFCGNDGLAWYVDRLLEAECVDGVLLFGCGMGDWRGMGFDVMNNPEDVAVPERIALLPDAAPVEPPEPPEPPEDSMVDIYDFDGNLKDWPWLIQNFGDIKIHPIEDIYLPKDGDRVYRVSYFRARTGYAATLINVRDKQGKPVVGETVIFGWRTAEPHGYTNHGWNWTDNGAAGNTNSTGDVGPGMSKDGYYAPPDGGPYWCWVWDLPSEKVTGLGMIAGTFHDHIDVGYQEEVYGDGEPPPEPPSTDWEKNIERILSKVARVVEILEAAPPEPPPEPPDPPEPEVFAVEFFNNEDLAGPPIYTMTEAPPFWHDWGSGSPAPGVNADHVSGRWSGSFTFEAGTHTFNVKTDDGVRLWIDGNLILDKWHPQAPTPYAVDVPLTAGLHEVRLEWFERAGGATLHFNWE